MARTVDLMLRVVREGTVCKDVSYHDGPDSGPFTVSRFAIRWGQVRLVFDPYGGQTSFRLSSSNVNDMGWPTIWRSIDKSTLGWGVVLREFARRIPALREPMLKNGMGGPNWHCYLPRKHRYSLLEQHAIIHQAAE